MDIFLAKYDINRNLIWVRTTPGLGVQQVTDITIGKDDKVYITGYMEYRGLAANPSVTFGKDTDFEKRILFSGPQPCSPIKCPPGSSKAFVAAYDVDGTFRDVSVTSAIASNDINGIASDDDNDLYLLGNYNRTVSIGGSDNIGEEEADGNMFLTRFGLDTAIVIHVTETSPAKEAKYIELWSKDATEEYSVVKEINENGQAIFSKSDLGNMGVYDMYALRSNKTLQGKLNFKSFLKNREEDRKKEVALLQKNKFLPKVYFFEFFSFRS